MLWIGGKARQVDGAFDQHRFRDGRTMFMQIDIHKGVLLHKAGQHIGKYLHGALDRNAQLQAAVVLVVDLVNLLLQVVVDREDLFCCFDIFFAGIGQRDRVRGAVKNGSAEIGLHQLDHLA